MMKLILTIFLLSNKVIYYMFRLIYKTNKILGFNIDSRINNNKDEHK